MLKPVRAPSVHTAPSGCDALWSRTPEGERTPYPGPPSVPRSCGAREGAQGFTHH